jgi:WD40 repeat protein
MTRQLWSITYADKTVLRPLEGHTNCINSVVFFQHSMRIVSDKTVRVWNVEIGHSVLRPFEDDTGWVSTVAGFWDGKRIASGLLDNTIRLWNADTGNVLWSSRKIDVVRSVALSSDGKHITSGSKMVRLWNAVT